MIFLKFELNGDQFDVTIIEISRNELGYRQFQVINMAPIAFDIVGTVLIANKKDQQLQNRLTSISNLSRMVSTTIAEHLFEYFYNRDENIFKD